MLNSTEGYEPTRSLHCRYLEVILKTSSRCSSAMNDLQQTRAVSPPSPPSTLAPPSSASFCISNGALGNNNHINMSSSSNSNRSSNCFAPSSVSAPSLPSSTYPWGTWEDLLLASAVLKHGIDNWSTVSCELQARAFLVPPSLFSAEACKGRFWILNGRFSSCSNGAIGDGKIPWFEEVRKLRVAQLRRELELYDGSIGLLQKKLNRLKAERGGSETKTSIDTHELQDPNGPASDDVERCIEVSSAGDRMPPEKLSGISLDGILVPETVKSSCTIVSPDLVGDGGLETAVAVHALQESSALKSTNCNAYLSGPVVEDIPDQHLTTIKGCQNLDNVNELTSIKVPHESLEPQVCLDSILEVKTSCQDVEGKFHIQSGAPPSIAANKTFEPPASIIGAQDNNVPVTGEVERVPEHDAFQHDVLKMDKCTDKCEKMEDQELVVKDTINLDTVPPDSLAGIERTIDFEVGGFAVKDTGPVCSPAQTKSSININIDQLESNQCQNMMASSAAAQTSSVLKGDDRIDHTLMSASAMDLLRIAYADGTPVSTPEVAEGQPLEEELNGVKETDSLCSLLDHRSIVHEANLIGLTARQVPCEGAVKELSRELELTEKNQRGKIEHQIGEIQTTMPKLSSLKESMSVKAGGPDLASGFETECVREPKICSVERLAEIITGLPKVTEVSLIKVGVLAEEAHTVLSQDMEVGPLFKLKLHNEVSANPREKSSVALAPHKETITQEIQDLQSGGDADNLGCCKSLAVNSNLSLDGRACLERVKDEDEDKPCEEGCKQEVGSVATENLEISPNIVSNSNLLDEHPACPVKELDNTNQVRILGSQSVAEQTKRPGTAIAFSSEISGLASIEHPPVAYSGLSEGDSQVQKASPCDSDGRSPVVEAVSESVDKQQKSDAEDAGSNSLFRADNESLKLSYGKSEGRMPEIVAEPKPIHKHAKSLEGPVQMVGSKVSLDPGVSSPHLMAEHSVDEDLLEEDGLLVDLMKLKGTDLTNLKKRKHLHKNGGNVDTIKDCGAPRERLDETSAHKQLKLLRSQEGDRKAQSADTPRNKDSGSSKKLKLEFPVLDGSGENMNQAALSSNVSIVESQDKSRSKEPAIEVFSTRRSRLKLRKLESASKELDKVARPKDGSDKRFDIMAKDNSFQKSEDTIVDVGDEESSLFEVSGLVSPDDKPLTRLESTNTRLLPDLVILLECLRSISGHRFAPLFKLRPEIQGDAKYRLLIKKHMDLITVRNKLEEGTYSGSLEFFRDMMLIFSNALVFYSRESQEYGAARVLRESLLREMERYSKKVRTHGSPAAIQAVKCNDLKVLKDMSTSVTTSDAKRQGSMKASCDHMTCDTDLDVEVGTNEVNFGTRLFAKDSGLETSKCVIDLDWKKKDRGIKVPGKSLNRGKTTRTKTNEIDDDKNMISGLKERISREKSQRILEDGNSKLSFKKEPVTLNQGSKRPYQVSSRPSREYTPKREMSEKSRSSKYSSGRQVSASQGRQGEPRKSLGGGRSSRSAQQSKQAYLRGNHSLSQPQKRARM